MRHDHNLGKQLLEFRTTRGQTIRKKISYIALASFASIVGLVGLIITVGMIIDMTATNSVNFGYIAGGVSVTLIGPLFGIPLAIGAKKYGRCMEVVLYEFGLKHTVGTEVTEVAFSDIRGIRDVQWWDYVRNNGGGGGDWITTWREATIIRNNGTEFELYCKLVPNYKEFLDTLDTNFTEYLFKDITLDYLHTTNIWFGEKLELRAGQFIHNRGEKKGKETISLNSVLEIKCPRHPSTTGRRDSTLKLKGLGNETLAKISLEDMMNINALFQIIEMSTGNPQVRPERVEWHMR